MRYYTLKDAAYRELGRPEPFPYDEARTYTGLLRYITGDHQYFDAHGRMIGMDDRFGNHVIIEYEGDGDVVFSKISRIIDSLGQATTFKYSSDRITIVYPRGGRNAIEVSYLIDEEGYLSGYIDPIGGKTTFESRGGLARHDLISRTIYPNDLEVRYDYGELRFYASDGGNYHRLDCVTAVHSTAEGETRTVKYDYNPDGTSHNFTGYPKFRVAATEDTLLNSGDNEYRYGVRIDDGILLTEHDYNRIHLELETRTKTRNTGKLISKVVKIYPGEGEEGDFPLYRDLRWDHPNYQSPIRVVSETYDDDNRSRRQHIVETDLDDYGQPVEIRCYRSDRKPEPDALLWRERTTYDYPSDTDAAHYGLALKIERWDHSRASSTDNLVRRTVNSLTQDRKCVEATEIAFLIEGSFSPDRRRRFEYDSRGRVIFEEYSWTDGTAHIPQKSETWIEYLEQVPTVTIVGRDVANQTTTTVLDSATGWRSSFTDAIGGQAIYTYDNLGRLLAETDPLNVETRWSYEDRSGKATASFANGYEKYIYHNGFGDEVATADNALDGDSERRLSAKGYNSLGQVIWSEGILGENARSRYSYDDRGRPSASVDTFGNETKYEYNDAQQSRTTWFNGFKVHEAATLDEVADDYSFSALDSDDRIVSTSVSDSFNCLAVGRLATRTGTWLETHYEYDNQLALRRYVTRGSDEITGIHNIERDLFGNVRQETIEVGLGGSIHEGDRLQAKGDVALYNELNQLVEDRNQIGQSSRYTYDPAGRQATFTDYSGTVFNSRYHLNNQIDRVFFEAEGGKVAEKRFAYDPMTHALKSIEEVIGGTSQGAIERTYLRDGSLSAVIYPDGRKVMITHDLRHARVSSVTDALGNTTTYGYDPAGRLISAETTAQAQRVRFEYYDRSEDAANSGRLKSSTTNSGLCRTYRYDGFGLVDRITFTDVRGDVPKDLFTTELRYALPTKNLLEAVCRSEAHPDNPGLNRRLEYSYNSLNQLTREQITSLIDGSITAVDYEYDAANNVLRESRTNEAGTVQTTNYFYDADNRLLRIEGTDGPIDLKYDVNGNLESDGQGATYRYDKKGRLIGFSHQQTGIQCGYSYYPNELRSEKRPGTETPIRYYYDGSPVPSVVNESQSGIDVSYLQAGNERLLRLVNTPTASTQQHLITGAKDVAAVLDEGLSLTRTYDYTPYGDQPNSVSAAGIIANPFQYTRQYTDSESGLIYLRSRYYHPGLKRFLTRDTATLLNRYCYGDGNPVNGTDLTGEVFGIDDFLIGLAVSAIIGAAIGATIGGVASGSWKGAGFGALAGAVGGAVTFATGTAITGAIAAAGIEAAELGIAAGFAIGAGTGAASGAAGGAAGQAAANAAGDDGDIGASALLGAVIGGVVGGFVGGRATFRFRNGTAGSPNSIQRFGQEMRNMSPAARPQLMEDVSPRMLRNLPHNTPTWRRVGSTIRAPGESMNGFQSSTLETGDVWTMQSTISGARQCVRRRLDWASTSLEQESGYRTTHPMGTRL